MTAEELKARADRLRQQFPLLGQNAAGEDVLQRPDGNVSCYTGQQRNQCAEWWRVGEGGGENHLCHRMTDLVAPPDDPNQRRKWANQLLREFPPDSQAVSAREIRAWARRVLRELNQQRDQPQQNPAQPELFPPK